MKLLLSKQILMQALSDVLYVKHFYISVSASRVVNYLV